MGYDFTGGRIFDFPIDFSMGLTTVQRYCAACDTIAVDSVKRFNPLKLYPCQETSPESDLFHTF